MPFTAPLALKAHSELYLQLSWAVYLASLDTSVHSLNYHGHWFCCPDRMQVCMGMFEMLIRVWFQERPKLGLKNPDRCVLEMKLRERGRTHVLTHAQAPSLGRVKEDPGNVRDEGPASRGSEC